jgi:phosphoribosylglycinamide formyltransferase 1
MSQTKILFLSSGNGGTIKFLFYAIKKLRLETKFDIIKVIADRECGSIEFAQKVGLTNLVIKYNRQNINELYDQIAITNKPDIVITNIHKVLDKEIISIPNINFINLHYSLLPAFEGMIGMKTIEEAKKRNVKFIGTSTHWVNEVVDQGPIICQSSYPVNWDQDSIKDVEQIIFESACLCLLNTLYYDGDQSIVKYQEVLYNPGLTFNPGVFDEYFWNEVKKA